MNGFKRILFLICFVLLVSSVFLFSEPRFYLSTDKIFSPGEDSYVSLESREISYVDIRVYRIDDPLKFFMSQEKPHQPKELNEYAGVNSLKILRTVFDRGTTLLRELPRAFIFFKFRADILSQFENLKEAMIPSDKHPIHSEIRLLGNYPVIRYFRHYMGQTPPPTPTTSSDQSGEESQSDDSYDSNSGSWIYERIPVYESTPGIYLVEGVHENHVGYSMVIVSKNALITKQSGDSLLCYVVDKITGNPIPDTPVTVLNNSTLKKIAEGITDKKGLFFANVKNVSQITVISGNNKQYAIIDPVFFPVSIDHRKAYIYTDRPVYRPGQEVFYKGIVRDNKDEIYNMPASSTVKVVLYGPDGTEMAKDQCKINSMGTFNGKLQLNEEAPLGTYKIISEINGRFFQGEFKIEEYKKPKFMVQVLLDGSGVNGTKINAVVQGKYYFGPPVQNAKVAYYIYRTRFYIPWWTEDQFNWYYSEAEYRSTRQELVTQGEGQLNPSGLFNFSFETQPDSQDYTYIVEAKVRDDSGYTVTSSSTFKMSTGQFNIGIRSDKLVYLMNQDVTLTFITRDLNFNPIAAEFDLKAVQVALTDKNNPASTGVKEAVVFSKHIQTDKNGYATVTFKASKSGQIVLSAKGLDKFNNVIQSTSSIWVASQGQSITYAGEGIEIVADKLSYRSGDKAKFLVLSRIPNISFLFTVEGGNLYYYDVHQFTGNTCLIDIPIKAQYIPTVYVQASAIVDDRFFQCQKTLVVPPVEKLLNVSITTDKKIYFPRDTVNAEILVLDNKKQPVQAEVSLGVVDESIYAICPELAVEMQKFFYPRKRNNVRTNNSLIFNFYGYSEEIKRELADMEMKKESGLSSFKVIFEKSIRERFKDTSYWGPTLMTAANGKATVSFKLPDNITQWRFTARAVTPSTQVGTAVYKIISRRNLTLSLDPPLSFTEGDEIILPVLLKNITIEPIQGEFSFNINGGQVIGPYNKTFSLGPNGSCEIPVKVKIISKGNIVLDAYANAGKNSDAIQLTVPVTPYGVQKTLALTDILTPAEKKKTIRFNLTDDGYNRFMSGKLYLHSGIYRAILSSLNYLAEYPYGCVEQTMSKFLPDVVVSGVLQKLSITNEELEKKVPQYVVAGIDRLKSFHKPGGWGWFNESEPDDYMTAYVMYGVVMANSLDYSVDDDLYQKGLDALEAQVARSKNDDIRILCLNVLAMAGRTSPSIALDIYKRRSTLSNYSLALLALTLSNAGRDKEAVITADLLISKCTFNQVTGTASWTGSVKYRILSEKAEIETTAAALQALIKIRPKDARIYPAARWLMQQRNGERWDSTRDTAAAVIALAQLIENRGLKEKTGQPVRYRLNGKEWTSIFDDTLYNDDGKSAIYLPYDQLKKGENIIEIEKESDMEVFTSLMVSYFTTETDVETKSGPLTLHRQYFRLSAPGNNGKRSVTPIDPADIRFNSGEEFLVKLYINPVQSYDYMVLEDFIPAGFQVIDSLKGYSFTEAYIDEYLNKPASTFKEVRDNRMVFFFNQLNANKPVNEFYVMRAALGGTYKVNPAVIRSMYYDERRALSSRLNVQVQPDKK